ncbi:MAG TPA: pitrilysin family protein [Bryobacteraceae bacterium]|nr:pitrilysin family protein [Bryobacteraceae bacterium]
MSPTTSSTAVDVRDISRTTLPNGLTVITEPMTHVRSVSLGIWIGTGARRETAEQNGISHFIEHMLFKGSESRSAEEIAKVIDSTGGHLDAYTAKELVSYNTKVIDDHLPLAFDVLADMILRPLFQPDDIEKEKGVILEELKMEVDNPEYLVHETFFRKFWSNHPLGRSILGTKATISSFSQQAVRGYYDQVYVPANMVITAAGRISHGRIAEMVEQYFGQLGSGTRAEAEPEPRARTPLELKKKQSLEQVHLCMGVPAYPIAHPRRYIVYVLSTLLGGGMSSRLFQNVREKHGLAYSIFSELNLYRDTGCLAVYSGTSDVHVKKVIGMISDEFRRLCNEAVPAEELRRAKDHMKGSLALSLESTSSRMSNLARQELFFGRFFSVDEMVEEIEKVTAEDILTVSRDLFAGRQAGVAVLGRTGALQLEAAELLC